MKHLRKAFSNHRLIRTSPEGSQEVLPADDSADLPTDSAGAPPLTWQRRKPSFSSQTVEVVPGFITLWDETEHKQAQSEK